MNDDDEVMPPELEVSEGTSVRALFPSMTGSRGPVRFRFRFLTEEERAALPQAPVDPFAGIMIGVYLRPQGFDEVDARLDGEGWVYAIRERWVDDGDEDAYDQDGELEYATIMLSQGKAHFGVLRRDQIDPTMIEPFVNKKNVRGVVRTLHTMLGRGKGDIAGYERMLADAAFRLGEVLT